MDWRKPLALAALVSALLLLGVFSQKGPLLPRCDDDEEDKRVTTTMLNELLESFAKEPEQSLRGPQGGSKDHLTSASARWAEWKQHGDHWAGDWRKGCRDALEASSRRGLMRGRRVGVYTGVGPQEDGVMINQIDRDLTRLGMGFGGKTADAQEDREALRRILIAYGKAHQTVGYVQSMGYIAAFIYRFAQEALLSATKKDVEEQAYWMFTSFMQIRDVEGMYLETPPLVLAYSNLRALKKFVAAQHRELGGHLEKLGFVAESWDMLLFFPLLHKVFIDYLPKGAVLVIFDALFERKSRVLTTVLESLLEALKPALMAAETMDEVGGMRASWLRPERAEQDSWLDDDGVDGERIGRRLVAGTTAAGSCCQ